MKNPVLGRGERQPSQPTQQIGCRDQGRRLRSFLVSTKASK